MLASLVLVANSSSASASSLAHAVPDAVRSTISTATGVPTENVSVTVGEEIGRRLTDGIKWSGDLAIAFSSQPAAQSGAANLDELRTKLRTKLQAKLQATGIQLLSAELQHIRTSAPTGDKVDPPPHESGMELPSACFGAGLAAVFASLGGTCALCCCRRDRPGRRTRQADDMERGSATNTRAGKSSYWGASSLASFTLFYTGPKKPSSG